MRDPQGSERSEKKLGPEEIGIDDMHDESPPATPFPSPSGTLLEQAATNVPNGQLRMWMHALPRAIRHYLSRWQLEWTGEPL